MKASKRSSPPASSSGRALPITLRDDPAAPPPELRARKVIDGGLLVLLAFTLAASLAVGLTRGWERVAGIVGETMSFFAVLSPKIGAGIFIAATLPLMLPRDRVAGWIGRESGLRGLVLASAAGAAIPGGPMMTFPLAAGFATAGAELGATIAFISGWSLLGLNRTLIWEFSFLPVNLVWTRYLICLPFPILLGLAARAVVGRQRA